MHIINAPNWPRNDRSLDEQWAFRCLMFYAGPLHSLPPIQVNPWHIRFAQVNTISGDWRFLSIVLRFSPEGQINRIDVMEKNPRPIESVTEMKFWTTAKYKPGVRSKKVERIDFTHFDLMWYLRDPVTQEKLLKNANAYPFQFWQNLLGFLVDKQLIAPDSIQTFDAKVVALFNSYNSPASEAETRAAIYRAAQSY
ncbi:hypothetical protein OPQ81_010741 [Rhizoctonia solani]|nr:hypothetical protein OPQ81_010741 [Rhizoctonia solani]